MLIDIDEGLSEISLDVLILMHVMDVMKKECNFACACMIILFILFNHFHVEYFHNTTFIKPMLTRVVTYKSMT